MKPDQLYQELKDLAERMQVTVSEENLKNAGIKVRSGLCIVKGRKWVVIDKHKSLQKKIKILAGHLSLISHEDMYIIPAVRELLEKYSKK
jgi:hypothetical protein